LTISAATRVAGVIGDPVRHSLSPVLHNTAYHALGLDWVYVAFEVPDGGARGALEAMRLLDLVGLSVTMPHKTSAASACDDLSSHAAALHSVNTVSVGEHGRLVGDSTDGEGFLRSLADAGHDPAGTSVVVLGAGGAARAVALALGEAGARVTVSARKPDAAERAAQLAGGRSVAWEQRGDAVGDARLIVNATPIGMTSRGDAAAEEAELPLPLEALHRGHVLADLVYHPIETPLLRGARDRGAVVVEGLGMLVHQAALQVERWTGRDAPVAVMRAAAELALDRRA
jgi:shikimate dehydrogenase